ncbi:MAG: DNA mismatch repair protein MutS [Candidatus Babeliales bacterium]
MTREKELTPLMKQYLSIKGEYPDAFLFFQVGDFYELFFEDAQKASRLLGITLTSRNKNREDSVPLCGVPVHACEHYMKKLIREGYKVALCQQLENPQPGTLVKRAVTQLLTPGTLVDEQLLDEKTASYICSFVPYREHWIILFGELLTAHLMATCLLEPTEQFLEAELSRFFPKEILLAQGEQLRTYAPCFRRLQYYVSSVDPHLYDEGSFQSWHNNLIFTHQEASIKNGDIGDALRLFYTYVRRTNEHALTEFKHVDFYRPDQFLLLDAATQRNLELVQTINHVTPQCTLFASIDFAATPMGSRMIKKWLLRPLVSHDLIMQRQQVVAFFVEHYELLSKLAQYFHHIGDCERVIGRIMVQRATVRDYHALRVALEILPQVKHFLESECGAIGFTMSELIGSFDRLRSYLADALAEENESCIIKEGFDERLDACRRCVQEATDLVVRFEQQEQERTTIASLKVRYNAVHGYYIEITKTHTDKIPSDYIRKQTLAGRERYSCEALQQYEVQLKQAHEDIQRLEKEGFEKIKAYVYGFVVELKKTAYGLAALDALHGLATVAYNYGYVRPSFNEQRDIIIEAGRHPVVERLQHAIFVPNDTALVDEASTWIMTGPNMGGKSTYLRQVALITILAQMGSFVPARKANVALIDRIFTRIGAHDSLGAGKSTFLVEMEETALICAHATMNSLVILDELGRGTSSLDGMAIARAVLEFIHTKIQARCLFATHYQALTQLATLHKGMANYYVSFTRTNTEDVHKRAVIFLYKLVAGVSEGSFGIDIARLAGLPEEVVRQATRHVMLLQKEKGIEEIEISSAQAACDRVHSVSCERTGQKQKEGEEIVSLLRSVNFDHLSPKQALDFIWILKDKVVKREK